MKTNKQKYSKLSLLKIELKNYFTNSGIVAGYALFTIVMIIKRNDESQLRLLTVFLLLTITLSIISFVLKLRDKNYKKFLDSKLSILKDKQTELDKTIKMFENLYKQESAHTEAEFNRNLYDTALILDRKNILESIYESFIWALKGDFNQRQISMYNELIEQSKLAKQDAVNTIFKKNTSREEELEKDHERVLLLKQVLAKLNDEIRWLQEKISNYY